MVGLQARNIGKYSMDDLYTIIDLPDLEDCQRELLGLVSDHDQSSRAWSISEDDLARASPRFWSWFTAHSIRPLTMLRVFVTAPRGHLQVHIDGDSRLAYPFSLNIPIQGTENTTHTFWDPGPLGKLNLRDVPLAHYLSACVPLNPRQISVLERIEILSPCFVKSDCLHSVENPKDSPRIMLSLRWDCHPELYRQPGDVWRFDRDLA